jgi:hypothetical protein
MVTPLAVSHLLPKPGPSRNLTGSLQNIYRSLLNIYRNKHWLRMKGWKKIYQANGPYKQAVVAILISNKVDFKLTLIK